MEVKSTVMKLKQSDYQIGELAHLLAASIVRVVTLMVVDLYSTIDLYGFQTTNKQLNTYKRDLANRKSVSPFF